MKIVILDIGCSNLASVIYAVQRLGYQPKVSSIPEIVRHADKLLLPGVGAAQTAMIELQQRTLIDLIKSSSQKVLGICLGMQLLALSSEENGGIETLGIIDAHVKQMVDCYLPLPHIGWNQISVQPGHPLFQGIKDGAYCYFVHSYAIPIGPYTIGQTNYGINFSAALQRDNFFGVQFHPERSGKTGAQLLRNFLEM